MFDPEEPLAIAELKACNQTLAIAIESNTEATSFNSNFIRVESFQGQESVSQPFSFNLELRADTLSDDHSGVFKTLDARCIGLWARLKIEIHGQKGRFFRGLVTEVSKGAPGVYSLTLQSPFQLLSLRNRYHIYSNCTIQSLLTEVFANELQDPRFALRFDFDDSLTLTREQDWLQAGETDMEFVMRILGHGAIHYYFIHERSKLTLVFSNSPITKDTVKIPESPSGPVLLRYSFTSIEKLHLFQGDLMTEFRYAVKMMPGYVRSLVTRTEAEWESNAVASFYNHDRNHNLDSFPKAGTGFQHHRCYDYGTSDGEAEGQLQKICQQIETEAGTLTGTTTNPLLSPGYCFTLTSPLAQGPQGWDPRIMEEVRPEFNGKTFVVTKIQHKMEATDHYTASVEATEVTTGDDNYKKTFLTPFSIANTQQGSVLAKVLDHEVPAGWRYRNKKNFQPETGQARFNNQAPYAEKGCLVRLATGQEHWVALPRSSTTVPEVGAMVMIGRGSNESEQPELLQVLASHGSKTIQPPDRRNASWLAHTSWGSNYSTSYGDGISIRYGHNSATDLTNAIRLVEGAYDNVGMQGTLYGNSSYSKGGSWSVSLSDNADVGVLGASISQGSSFSESHSDHNYGYSSVNLSENYSEVGKSASVSVIGEYVSSPDLSSPSFVSGKVPKDVAQYSDQLSSGDTFSRSTIWNRSMSTSGIGLPAPPVPIPAVGPSGSYSASVILGITQNASTHIGASFSESLMVGLQFSSSVNCSDRFTTGLTVGNSYSLETRIGNVNSISTTVGNNNSITTNVSNNTSLGVNVGNTVSTQINVSNTQHTGVTVGNSTDTTAYIGTKNSTNLFVGATNDTSVNVAARKSNSVTVGAQDETSVNIAARKSTSVNIAAVDETNINVSARASTNISVGASDETNVNIAAKAATNIGLAVTDETNISIGLKASTDISLAASMSMELAAAASMKISNTLSASLLLQNSLSATAKIINQAGPEFEMLNGVTKAEMDQRQQAKLRQTIIEIISGIDSKM
jgi:type VI secretion system secreted protein VgrG